MLESRGNGASTTGWFSHDTQGHQVTVALNGVLQLLGGQTQAFLGELSQPDPFVHFKQRLPICFGLALPDAWTPNKQTAC